MSFESPKNVLLSLLADHSFHSGTELATTLGISRTAVWQMIRELESQGYEIAAVPGKGYRVLHPLELLNEDLIRASLIPETLEALGNLWVHDELDSTNTHLMRQASEGAVTGSVCIAETQSAGKGRVGRGWISPGGANVYLSVLWRYDDPSRIAGLSLAVGVAVVRVLHRAGCTGIGLKWPNDLLWHDHKLGGILVEAIGESHGQCSVVVGLGLNRYLPPNLAVGIEQSWIDLYQIMGTALPGRNILIALILNELLPLLRNYQQQGLESYLPDWRRYHLFSGRMVVIQQGQAEIKGRIEDVTSAGLLVLRCEDGRLREFASGDVRKLAAELQ
jgi:BirA family biotin operon repressor/biotin-[acetyl-CoA-carboxylase] ligase